MNKIYHLSSSFCGITVHPTTMLELTALVAKEIEHHGKCIIANHNLHSLYLYHRDPNFRAFYRHAKWTHIDGMSLVVLARLFGYTVNRDQRVTYVDWLGPLMESAARGHWRVLYIGSAPGVAETGANILRQRYGELQIRTLHGYFQVDPQSSDNQRVLDLIAEYRPNLLLVGMGMPRQEFWIKDNFDRVCANVILPSGAAMDYVAGALFTPPRWAARAGLEWAFRLAAEPGRLWRRYLLEPCLLLVLLARYLVTRWVHSQNHIGDAY